MIYDSKETFMDWEERLVVDEQDETCIVNYEVDFSGLEEGKRILAIPYGITKINVDSFQSYNDSAALLMLQNKFVNPDKARDEWQKRLRGQRVIKFKFPDEVGKDWYSKAEFMRQKELRVRFLALALPETFSEYTPGSFPDLLEKIVVDEKNKYFTSVDGILYNKDMKKLLRYPGYCDEIDEYVIPDSVETIAEGAFDNSIIKKLVVTNSKYLKEGTFKNCIFDELVLPSDMEIIPPNIFQSCDIRKIVLPQNLKMIEDYAFCGIAGVNCIENAAKETKLGKAIFSEAYLRSVLWWPWDVIPEACFLNAEIKTIDIPEGVTDIEDYAFAGCYMSKAVYIPETVKCIGPNSFDLGPTFHANIKMPQALLHYAYRLPALSKVNGLKKNEAWKARENKEFVEDKQVLIRQIRNMEHYIGTLTVFQTVQKKQTEKEISNILSEFNIEIGEINNTEN